MLLTEFKGLLPRRLLVFPVLFLALFMSASILVDFSRLFSFSLGRSDFKSSPEQFVSLEAKAVCIAAGMLMD